MEYKNILWIDDCDTNDAGDIEEDFLENELNGQVSDDTNLIKPYFGEFYKDVKLIKEFVTAIEELNANHSCYDLVVFDMDMKRGMEKDEYDKIKNKLQEKRVNVKEEWDQFSVNAGIYLYFYLLNIGYPNSRMIILTGNGKDLPRERLENAFIATDLSNLVEKKGGEIRDSTEWIKKYYSADDYYCVRRMVYKSCEYWRGYLNQIEEKDIAFNELYYQSTNQVLTKEIFENMLERVELLFPVTRPTDVETVYYQALQVTTMFHEESAKLVNLDKDKYKEIKKYHQMIRNFRNWSAHNKFQATRINASIFIFLFCITLRTYFESESSEEGKLISKNREWYKIYEKEAFECIDFDKLNYARYEEYYRQDWQRHFNKIKNSDDAKKKCWECRDINRLLLESGNCDNKKSNKMEITDCLLNLLENHLVRDEKFRDEGSGYLFSIEYKWNCAHPINKGYIDELLSDSDSYYIGLAIALYLKIKGA